MNLKLYAIHLFFSALNSILSYSIDSDRVKNQSGCESLNLENGSFVNSDNFDATDLRL